MSRKQITLIAGLLLVLTATILWMATGWHFAYGVIYMVAAALFGGAGGAWLAERGD